MVDGVNCHYCSVGSVSFRSFGSFCLAVLYSEIPIGELIFDSAYFARTLFFSLQISKPIAGLSFGVFYRSSNIAT